MKKEYITPEFEAVSIEFFDTNDSNGDSNELPFLPASVSEVW